MSRSHRDGRRGGGHDNIAHGIGDTLDNRPAGKAWIKRCTRRACRRNEAVMIWVELVDHFDTIAEDQAMWWWLEGCYDDEELIYDDEPEPEYYPVFDDFDYGYDPYDYFSWDDYR